MISWGPTESISGLQLDEWLSDFSDAVWEPADRETEVIALPELSQETKEALRVDIDVEDQRDRVMSFARRMKRPSLSPHEARGARDAAAEKAAGLLFDVEKFTAANPAYRFGYAQAWGIR